MSLPVIGPELMLRRKAFSWPARGFFGRRSEQWLSRIVTGSTCGITAAALQSRLGEVQHCQPLLGFMSSDLG